MVKVMILHHPKLLRKNLRRNEILIRLSHDVETCWAVTLLIFYGSAPERSFILKCYQGKKNECNRLSDYPQKEAKRNHYVYITL